MSTQCGDGELGGNGHLDFINLLRDGLTDVDFDGSWFFEEGIFRRKGVLDIMWLPCC